MNTAVHNPRSPSGPNNSSGPLPEWRQTSGEAHLRLTHTERDAASERIKLAYTEGKLDENEFEERIDLVMIAKVRADLEPLLADIEPQPAQSPENSPGVESRPDGRERVLAAVGHASGYFLSALGPLFVLLLDGKSSLFVRRHAIEALNYQLTFVVGSVVLLLLSWLVLPLIVWLFMLLGWIFLPAIAGLATLLGARWKYPLTWRPVKE